jgi:hypothetical protein
MRDGLLLVLLGVVAVVMYRGGCDGIPDNLKWREEVQLSDGRVVVVTRRAKLRDETPLGDSPAITVVGTSLRVDGPNVQTPPWSGDAIATRLDVDRVTGRFVIVATTDWCAAWHRGGRPANWLWAFELQDGVWTAVPVPTNALPRMGNLLPVAYDRYGGAQRSFVSIADKKALISSVDYVSPLETNDEMMAEYLAGQGRLCIERQPLQEGVR